MKEATGEVSMTVVTLVAIAVIGAIVALIWPKLQTWIGNMWGLDEMECTDYDASGNCIK